MSRGPLVLASLALVLAAASVLLSVVLFDRVSGEGQDRRDQTCVLFERQHETEVKRLAQTYRYLLGLSPEEQANPLNRAVAAQLPELEERVKTIAAPPYCDEPGVGLSEPNPEIPKRPEGI